MVDSVRLLQQEYSGPMTFFQIQPRGINNTFPFSMRCYCVVRLVPDTRAYLVAMDQLQRSYMDGHEFSCSPVEPEVTLTFDEQGCLTNLEELYTKVYIPQLAYSPRDADKVYPRAARSGRCYQMTCASEATASPTWSDACFMFALPAPEVGPDTGFAIELYRCGVAQFDGGPQPHPNRELDRPLIQDMVCYATIGLQSSGALKVPQAGGGVDLDHVKVNFVGRFASLGERNSVPTLRLSLILPDIRLDTSSGPDPSKTSPTVTQVQEPRTDRKSSLSQENKASAGPSAPQRNKSKAGHNHDDTQNQRVIDRLLLEIECRSEAIRRVGEDLIRVRQLNAHLEEANRNLRMVVASHESKAGYLIEAVDIETLSLDEIRRRYAVLAGKLRQEKLINRGLTERLEEAQAAAIEKNEIQKKLLELRHAHTTQQVYVQKLQDSVARQTQYKKLVKSQEEVIQRMGMLLKESLSIQKKAGRFFEICTD
ncbi:uncharacterized protein BJ171DRAFT_312124 [Polychytrium aggregatum]|uniref:uncharacterized protein n=1 Tax=Polychytrium aggregatum TaxID=110093 RepID=UPI0022FDF6ED|nr:uncharacterized protein BJ171DRAFT_312124 [Polychytrium aggregatum]KAI9207111.1 hypothetical protein BJ171DRAFT_312124 [Polychytrium aggregatum]